MTHDEGISDHRAGWVALTDFLAPNEVDEVCALCADLLALPAAERRAGDKVSSGTRHLFELDDRSGFVDAIVERPSLASVVAEILGPTFHRGQVSYRSPQPGFGGQYLHADDVAKPETEPDSVATAIIALTAFTEENGATRVVPGSHRRPDLQRLSGSLDNHPDQVTLTGPAGTAFVFSGHLLHSGMPNGSSSERPALQLLWRHS